MTDLIKIYLEKMEADDDFFAAEAENNKENKIKKTRL